MQILWPLQQFEASKILAQTESDIMPTMIPMKEWRIREAKRCNVDPMAIAGRLSRGKYRGKIQVIRKNARVVFVVEKKPIPQLGPYQRHTLTMNEPTGIEAQVCADIAARQKKGIAKYGVTVEQNPLTLLEWLKHAYEESLDLPIYLKRSIVELELAIEEQKKAP